MANQDILTILEQRLGRRHARQRLGIEKDHEAQVFGQGINFFHIENLAPSHVLICALDAPVSGGKGPAEEGKLVILASGDRAHAGEAVQRFFDAVGTQTHWLGDAGQERA